MKDAHRKREPFEFAQIIIRAAKSANMTTFSQIYLIYNNLKLEFRRDLTKPTQRTTMNVFLQKLEDNKKIWWDLGARHRGGGYSDVGNRHLGGFNRPGSNALQPQQGQDQYDGYRGGGNGFGLQASNSNPPPRAQFPTSYQFRNPFQYQASYQPAYQNRAYQPQQQVQSQRHLQPSGEYPNYSGRPNPGQVLLQRQAGRGQPYESIARPMPSNSANASGVPQPQRPPFRPFNNYNNQAQRQQQGQRAYHDEADENKNPDHGNDSYGNDYDMEYPAEKYGYEEPDSAEDPSHGYHGQNEPKSQQPEQDVESFFLRIPKSRSRDTRCQRCGEEFPSRNKLHKHLRSCKVKTATPIKTEDRKYLDDVVVVEAHQGAAEVVYSTAPAEDSQGLGFRSWQYATAKATIQSIQDDDTVDVVD